MTDTVHNVEGFEGVLKNFSDEQLDTVRESAASLMTSDPTLNKICSVLIASRQLYALARYALHREMTKEGIDWSSGVEEFLIKAMADKANQPFTRTGLFTSLASTVKPFIAEEVSMEAEEEHTMELLERQQEFELKSKRRVTGPITLLPGETHVVVGLQSDISKFAEALENSIVEFDSPEESELAMRHNLHRCVTVIFDDATAMDSTLNESGLASLRIGVNKWMNVGKSPTEFNRFLGNYTHKLLGERVDLLIVKEGIYLNNATSPAKSAVACVCDGVKAVRKTMKTMSGCAVVLVAVDDAEQQASFLRGLQLKYNDIEDVSVYAVPTNEEAADAV
jgi:hypothetical protein